MSTQTNTTHSSREEIGVVYTKCEEIVLFHFVKDPRNQGLRSLKLSAKHGVGVGGREGMDIYPHQNDPRGLCEGAQLVEWKLRPFDRFAFAKLSQDRDELTTAIDDLSHQLARLRDLDPKASELNVNCDWETIAILKFVPQPNGEEQRIVAFHGKGFKGGKGLTIFPHRDATLSVQTGWQLVKIHMKEGLRYGLAQSALNIRLLNQVINDLQEQLNRCA